MRITVYLGSSKGNTPAYEQAAKDLGAYIAEGGHTLVYGGSNVGLMKTLADAVLDRGGRVIGIEPRLLHEQGFTYDRLTELILTETVAERREKLMECGDVLIALPGGLGTLDEITEAIEMAALDTHRKPCILYNVDGYYDLLRAFLDEGVSAGFIAATARDGIFFADSVKAIDQLIGGNDS